MKLIRSLPLTLALALPLAVNCQNSSSATSKLLPNPVLFLIGTEEFESGGKQFTRYKFAIDNNDAFPEELFAASPGLPPCGKNANASRTWIDLYDQSGKRLYGFCALRSRKELRTIWFSLETGALPPSWIYVELNDRKTNTKYKSNLAETTL